MKLLLFTLCFSTLAGSALPAQELSAADRKKALEYLERTRAGVLAQTKGLSDAQWNFKPGPDRWSVAEVTEHIAATEDFLRNMVQEKVMKGPARDAGEDVKAIDEFVLQHVPERKGDRAGASAAYQPLRLTQSQPAAFPGDAC